MIKNTASQKIRVFAFDYSTGAPKTGDAANLTVYVAKDYGTLTALADTSATEVSSSNAPGWYEFDVSQSETNADHLHFTGKSTTANVAVVGQNVVTVAPNFAAASIDSNGRVDVIKVAGTTQTARDIGASVLLSAGTGTGQLDFTSGVVKANATQWAGTAVATPNTAGVPVVDARTVMRAGTAQSTGNSTTAIKLDSGASGTSNYYKGHRVTVVSGTGAPQSAICTGYSGVSKIATVAPAWPTAPDNTSVFVVEANAQADAEAWAGGAVAAVTQTGVPVVDVGYTRGTASAGAAGYMGVDWSAVNAPTSTVALTGTTIASTQQVDVNTIKTKSVTCASGVTVNAIVGNATAAIAVNGSGQVSVGDISASFGLTPARSGTAQAGASTSITLDASASAVNDFYNNARVFLTGGTGAGQSRRVLDYVGSTKVATVRAWATTPDNTTTFAVLPEESAWDDITADHLTSGSTGAALNAAGSAGDPWSTAVPGAYGAGTAGYILGTNLNATVSSRGTSTLTQAQVTGGAYALNSSSFAFNTALDFTTTQKTSLNNATPASVTGAVGSVTGAVGSVTGGVGGDVAGKVLGGGAGTITAVGAWALDGSGDPLATAQGVLNSTDATADALTTGFAAVTAKTNLIPAAPASTTNITAASGVALSATGLDAISVADPGAPASHTTLAKRINAIWRALWKKETLTATELKRYADDGTTVNGTATVSDDGTTQTRGTFS